MSYVTTFSAPPLGDIDVAWDNSGSVADADAYRLRWTADAAAFRARHAGRARLGVRYGNEPRQHYDLFLPVGEPRGLVVFVHGGYWIWQEIANWSHFSAGPLAHGFAMALPEYTLCPEGSVPRATREIGACIDQLAGMIAGPIALSGHSAGGHLATRMLCADAPLPPATAARIGPVVSISGVHDLRCLLGTAMNETLRLDLATARAESPALAEPRAGIRLACIAGGAELPEFRRQNALLANAWHGLGARTSALEVPGRNHFDIVDDLADPDSEMVTILTGRG